MLATMLTTRLITINTTSGTPVVATSGARYMQVFNIGSSTVAWGDEKITTSSAGLLYYSMSEIFNPIQGDFALYFIADGTAGRIAVNEFA